MLIALAILGLVAMVGGAIITALGQAHQAEAAAEAAAVEAENLQELSSEGGYYDQVLAALQTELNDIEADRDAAATALQLTEQELGGQKELSAIEEAAQVAGLEAQKAGQEAQKAGQAVQGLETARTGAEAKGAIAARAGAGGVSVGSGSVLRTAASVNRAIGRRVAVANMQIGASNQAIGATNLAVGATQAAGALQRETLQNNITRARLNYADTLRGLDTREAQTTAQQTLTEFNQEAGLEQAGLLQTEADWLTTTAPGLIAAGAVFNALGGVAKFGASLPDVAAPQPDVAAPVYPGGGEFTPGENY